MSDVGKVGRLQYTGDSYLLTHCVEIKSKQFNCRLEMFLFRGK